MRIALGIEYSGTNFFGWQSQPNLPTVQASLEQALSIIADQPIQVFCAGRTDTGVHATGQVVHFDTTAVRIPRAWILGTNTHLTSDVAVRWMQEVDAEFHARFSAKSRRYRYVIYNNSIRSAVSANRVAWYHPKLDVEKMREAAAFLIGEHDFTSFRSAGCQAKHPVRNVHFIKITEQANVISLEIQANAFLHHMVRNIAGVLMRIGSGVESPAWCQTVLQNKDRRLAAETSPASGLFLTNVQYPEIYQFPQAGELLLI